MMAEKPVKTKNPFTAKHVARLNAGSEESEQTQRPELHQISDSNPPSPDKSTDDMGYLPQASDHLTDSPSDSRSQGSFLVDASINSADYQNSSNNKLIDSVSNPIYSKYVDIQTTSSIVDASSQLSSALTPGNESDISCKNKAFRAATTPKVEIGSTISDQIGVNPPLAIPVDIGTECQPIEEEETESPLPDEASTNPPFTVNAIIGWESRPIEEEVIESISLNQDSPKPPLAVHAIIDREPQPTEEGKIESHFLDQANTYPHIELPAHTATAHQRIEKEEIESPLTDYNNVAYGSEALSACNTTNIDANANKTSFTSGGTIRTNITDAGDCIRTTSIVGFRRLSEKEEEDEAVVANSQSASDWNNSSSVSRNSMYSNAEPLPAGSVSTSNCSTATSNSLGSRSKSLFYSAAYEQKLPIKHESENLSCTSTPSPLTDLNKLPITSKYSLFFGTIDLDETTEPTEGAVQKTSKPVECSTAATTTEIAVTAISQNNDCAGKSIVPPKPVKPERLSGTFNPTTTTNTVDIQEQPVSACIYRTQILTQPRSTESLEAQAASKSIPVKPPRPSSATLSPVMNSVTETLDNEISIPSEPPQNNDTPIKPPKPQRNSLKANAPSAHTNSDSPVLAMDLPSPVYKIASPQCISSASGSSTTSPSMSALSTSNAQDTLENNGKTTISTSKSRISSSSGEAFEKMVPLHTDQRQALIDRRENFTNTLKASFMDPISVKIDACREIHRAVSHHQLAGLNTRYPGYVFARDEGGNTVFHNANTLPGLQMSVEIFEELAKLVDTSEFGDKILPPVIQVDPYKVFPILKHLSTLTPRQPSATREPILYLPNSSGPLSESSLNSVSPDLLLTGWLYKRHDRKNFERRFCTLSFEALKYFESDEIATNDPNGWISSLKLTGSMFKVQRFDRSHGQFGSQSYFSIKSTERSKRKKSIPVSFGSLLTSKYARSIDDQVEMDFVAESDLLTLQWIYVLRVLTDHVAPLPMLTNQKCINIEARAIILNVVNSNGDTPLHTLAKAFNNEASNFSVLSCIQWLIINECNPFTKNNDGKTAYDIVAQSSHSQYEAIWIKILTGLLVHGSHRPRAEDPYALPPAPIRIPGYSYLSFVLRDLKYLTTTDTNRSFLDLKHIKLAMFVLSDNGKTIEFAQRVDEPFLKEATQLFWGNTFHLSIPLENMPEGSYVLFQLSGWPHLSETTSTGRSIECISEEGMIYIKYVYRINTTNISSGAREIKFTDPPMIACSVGGSSIEAPPSAASAALSNTVLSLFLSISRIAL